MTSDDVHRTEKTKKIVKIFISPLKHDDIFEHLMDLSYGHKDTSSNDM